MQALYGGDPAAWYKLPAGKFAPYAEMLPRLEAQRKLDTYHAVLAGSGQMRQEDQRDWLRELDRHRRGGRLPVRKPQSADELRALGINVS